MKILKSLFFTLLLLLPLTVKSEEIKLDDKTIVVNKNDDKSFEVLQDALLSEEDGKLSI